MYLFRGRFSISSACIEFVFIYVFLSVECNVEALRVASLVFTMLLLPFYMIHLVVVSFGDVFVPFKSTE